MKVCFFQGWMILPRLTGLTNSSGHRRHHRSVCGLLVSRHRPDAFIGELGALLRLFYCGEVSAAVEELFLFSFPSSAARPLRMMEGFDAHAKPGKTHPAKPNNDWTFLLEAAPPIIWRSRWDTTPSAWGFPIAAQPCRISTTDRGKGRQGISWHRVGYRREALVEWLQNRDRGRRRPEGQYHASTQY